MSVQQAKATNGSFRERKEVNLSISTEKVEEISEEKRFPSYSSSEVDESETFLHAAVQLLQRQSDTRQGIKRAWGLVKKLHAQQHMDTFALKQLHMELFTMLQTLHVDESKASGVKSPTTNKRGNLLTMELTGEGNVTPKRKSSNLSRRSSGTIKQTSWCCLHTEKGQLDLFAPPNTTESNPPTSLLSKLKLPSSIAWLLNDSPAEETTAPLLRSIDLHECRCEALPSSYGGEFRFDLRFPTGGGLVFEATDRVEQRNWIDALQRVCGAPLIESQEILSTAPDVARYAANMYDTLPVQVPLAWLRRAIQRREKGDALARRNAKNVPMLQITRDIERDRVRLNGEMVCGSGKSGGVDRLIRLIVGMVHNFDNELEQPRQTCLSPTSRLTNGRECMALGFAERVLRASSRTQGGGDIYDAISILCANRNVTICPVSHDVEPVDLQMFIQNNTLLVYAQITMQFKMTHIDTQDNTSECPPCAIVRGTLKKQFTYGQASEPGCVFIEWVTPDDDACSR